MTKDEQPPDVVTRAGISADAAQRVVGAARDAAASLGSPVTIAVVDDAGVLKALAREDGASIASVELAIDKAYTAVAMGFGVPTSDLFNFMKDDQQLLTAMTRPGRLTFLGGGTPIKAGGVVVGAVGVAGGHYSEDMKVAEAGAAAVES